jgi:gas vesicle protein
VADQQNANLSKFLSSQAKYLDERVDNMRKQKDEELEQYKRDIER